MVIQFFTDNFNQPFIFSFIDIQGLDFFNITGNLIDQSLIIRWN